MFAQLANESPAGLHYATFKQDDGVSFVHIASVETADGGNPLNAMSAFNEFTDQIRDRCEESPVAVDLREVGSYRLFSA